MDDSYHEKAIAKFSERTLNPIPMWSAVSKMEPVSKNDILDLSRRGPSLKLEVTEKTPLPFLKK